MPGIRTGVVWTVASLSGASFMTVGFGAASPADALLAMSLANSAMRSSDLSWLSDICCASGGVCRRAPKATGPGAQIPQDVQASHHTITPEL
jgi:hypothetical protein